MMPMKYKKFIFLFSLGMILIGFGTFFIISPDLHFSFHKRSAQELDALVQRYYTAKQQVDMDTIAGCVSNVGHIDEKKLMTESEYVEE